MLKGSFWNSAGFRDTTKHLVFSETILEFKSDFFVVLEIGQDNFSAHSLEIW